MYDGLDDAVSLVGLDVAHHAEVQVAELAVGGGQQVAGVGVGVEEPVLFN